MLIESGSDKTPDLEKDDRAGQQDPADQGQLQIKKNPSWYEMKMSVLPGGSTRSRGRKNQSARGRIQL